MKKWIWALIILAMVVIALVMVWKVQTGPIDRVNKNIPSNMLYQTRSEKIPENFLIGTVKNISEDSELSYNGVNYGFFDSEGFYCRSSGKKAEKIEYFHHSAGKFVAGGWYYREAYICGDQYWIFDAGDSFGGILYGPFEL
ncbi:MAG: hypothetical protein NTX24_00825 [Candidatus Pacearchaeota archaeon]|nr:hypothetical protein [Candidatus Pacearchaeota archaeon]